MVTVVVPTHDRREMLAATIRRVLAQTVPVDVVVVDDGSADDTAAWLAAASVRVVRHATPRGGGAARNAGAELARTPWLAFCDDDDLWAPTKLARQLDAVSAMPERQWSATGCVYIDVRDRVVGAQWLRSPETVGEQLRTGNAVPGGGSSLLVDRALFARVGGFATGLEGAHDWDLAIRLAQRSALAYVDLPLVAYRRWPGNRSRDGRRAALAHADIRRRHDLPPVGGTGQWQQDDARRRAEAGDRGGAARAWLAAAVRLRAPGQLAYAAAVLVSPQAVLDRLVARELADVPAGWRDEAEAWLGSSS